MNFVRKLFNSEKANNYDKNNNKAITNLTSIGEVDKCPYCTKPLEKIPTRKSKCPFCSEYIYSRSRPLDRKKVLVTERQKEEIELEWTRYYEAQEDKELMKNDDYAKAKKELAEQFGTKPNMDDVKWRVYNQRILEYASQKQWGLYRNNKLNMANLLEKENRLKQALSTLFEVCYLDLNGCNNVPTSDGKPLLKSQIEEYGIKEFDPKRAFLAPGIISMINDLSSKLMIKQREAKKRFIDINNKTRPLKDMPLSSEKAWQRLFDKLQFV